MSTDNAPVPSATNWTEFQSSLRHLEDKFEWLTALDQSSLITHGVTTDKLDESLQRLENVASIIRRARNCLAPINKLPPELLGLVFQRTVERHEPLAPFNSYPWKSIQAVCVYWKVTALHTPALWTEVRIPDEPLLEHQCRVISFLLDRSGSLPLTVYLARSIDMTPTDETLLDDICSDVWRIHELQGPCRA
ncbi:hypothetical protein BC629DRAFT_1554458 [Irpex lacteus]|nr:hypothetical protein BC629DRAFT_1554458 [Irpex lacteus]